MPINFYYKGIETFDKKLQEKIKKHSVRCWWHDESEKNNKDFTGYIGEDGLCYDICSYEYKKLDILIEEINLEQRFILNGDDISSKIRSNKVSKTVSLISSFSFVRELMVDLQRQYAVDKSIIVEGRDIGTIVF